MVEYSVAATEGADYGSDDAAPVVTMVAPIEALGFGSDYSITVSAVDDKAVDEIKLYRDGALVATFAGPGPHVYPEQADVNTNTVRVYSAFAVDSNDNASAGAFAAVTIEQIEDPWAKVTLGGIAVPAVYAAIGDDPLTITLENLSGGVHALVPVTSSETQVVSVASTTDVNGELSLKIRGRGVSVLTFTYKDVTDGKTYVYQKRVIVGDNIPTGRVTQLIVQGLPSVIRVGDPVFVLQVLDQRGLPLPRTPRCQAESRAPVRVFTPAEFSDGELPVTPISQGAVKLTLRYIDEANGEITEVIEFTVQPALST